MVESMNTGEGGSQADNSKIGCDLSEIPGIFETREMSNIV